MARYESPKIYACWSRDETTRYYSTSGGAFSEIVRTLLKKPKLLPDNGGFYFVGASYDEDNMIFHMIGATEDDLTKIRQSKYAQSEIGLVLRKIKKLLAEGNTVCFVVGRINSCNILPCARARSIEPCNWRVNDKFFAFLTS